MSQTVALADPEWTIQYTVSHWIIWQRIWYPDEESRMAIMQSFLVYSAMSSSGFSVK